MNSELVDPHLVTYRDLSAFVCNDYGWLGCKFKEEKDNVYVR